MSLPEEISSANMYSNVQVDRVISHNLFPCLGDLTRDPSLPPATPMLQPVLAIEPRPSLSDICVGPLIITSTRRHLKYSITAIVLSNKLVGKLVATGGPTMLGGTVIDEVVWDSHDTLKMSWSFPCDRIAHCALLSILRIFGVSVRQMAFRPNSFAGEIASPPAEKAVNGDRVFPSEGLVLTLTMSES